MARVPWWVWASLVGCLAVSLVSLVERHRVETSNRAVGLMLSMEDIESISASSEKSLDEVLLYLKDHGLVGVAVSEKTIGDLIEEGVVSLYSGDISEGSTVFTSKETDGAHLPFALRLSIGDARRPLSLEQGQLEQQITDDKRGASILSHLSTYVDPNTAHKFGDSSGGLQLAPRIYESSAYWQVPSFLRPVITDLSVGVDARSSLIATSAGLEVIARLQNGPLVNETVLDFKFKDTKNGGASSYLIAGDQAIGNRALLETTRDALIENDMTYLSPEFVVLGGDSYLRRELADRTIRLHSITQLEAEQMSQRDLNERFAKAFRERGVRWLLVRPTTQASDDSLKQMGETLVSIRSAIRSAGGEVKAPRPFEDAKPAIGLICLIGLITLPAVAWASMQTLGKTPLAWAVVGLYAAIDITAFLTEDVKKLALLIALAFPVIAFLVVKSMSKPNVIRDFLLFTGISTIGGMAVGAMLTGVDFMIRADQFFGTKLVIFGPILVVGYLLLQQHGGIKEIAKKPVTWGIATIAIAGLAAMFLMLARTGNENPSAVSGLELQIRSLLDQLLFVRPRTKEAILGHPALVLGLMLLAYRPNLKGWGSLLLFVGMIGQTSVVNTFCHLHTPIALSVARVGVGTVCGGIIGLLLWVVVKRYLPAEESN